MLDETDVLLWWGHMAHAEVADATVERIQARVLEGMGLIAAALGAFLEDLQAPDGHELRPEMARGGRARAPVGGGARPSDRRGLPERIELEREEMYGEHFDIPPRTSWSW